MKRAEHQGAIAQLMADHVRIKRLFDQFEHTQDVKKKKDVVDQTLRELEIHTALEEEIFYPTLREELVAKEEWLNQADEEHHVAKILGQELKALNPEDVHYDAKFTVLADNVRHHIKEEESELFPAARKTDVDFLLLGEEMNERREDLEESLEAPARASGGH